MTPSASLLTFQGRATRKATHVLTADQIVEIRQRRCGGARVIDLAQAFGVNRATIRYHAKGCVVLGPLRKVKSTPRTKRPNKFIFDGAICRIELEPGVFALIDESAVAAAEEYIWICNRRRDGRVNAVISTTHDHVRLHDLVFGPHDGFCLDHKNRDPLDNRLSNLRVASCSQNGMNRRPVANKSGYRGVVYRPHIKRWAATLKLHGVQHWFGTYETPVLAARARDEAAKRLHGDFAVLNFPEGHHAPTP